MAAGVLLLLGLAIGGGVVAWQQAVAPARALAKVRAYADDAVAHPPPTADDVRVALRIAADSPDGIAVSDHLEFLATVLAGDEVNAAAIADADALRDLLHAVAALQEPGGAGDEEIYEPLGVPVDERAARLLAEVHPQAFADYDEFRDQATACRDLVDLAGTEPDARDGRQVDPRLWIDLVDKAEADDPGARDYDRARPDFSAAVAEDDLESLAALVAAVQRAAPVIKQPEPMPEKPGPEQTAGGGEKPATPAPMPEAQKPPEAPKDPAAAFQALLAAMEAFTKEGKAAWPPDRDQGLELFSIPADLTDDLDVDVVVGTRFGFRPTAIRDGAGPAWTIKLGTECVARLAIEDGRVVLRRGDAPDAFWSGNEARLRVMPIAFKRQNIPLDGHRCVVPAAPAVPLKAGDTLHDLLCGDEGTSKKPEPATPLADATAAFRLRTGRIEIAGSPLALAVVPLADNRFALTFTAEIDGKPYTLTEPMSFDPTTGQLTRERDAWTERQARWERFAGATTADVERETLGLVAAGDGWRFRALGSPDRELPIVVGAVLADVGPAGDAATMMEAWVPGSSEQAKDGAKNPSLAEWREAVQKYVAGTNHPFGGIEGAAYEQANPRPADPGPFREPAKKKDEKADDHEARVAKARREHDDKQAKWNAWHAARDTAILAAVADRDRLRRFLVAHPQPAAEAGRPDPEYAAIHFLLALDGLVVAKTQREPLDDVLARVPVAALVEGDATAAGWSLADGTGGTLSITAPAARLLPAAVARAAAPRPADPLPADGTDR